MRRLSSVVAALLLLSVLLATGCGARTVKSGDTIKADYSETTDNGTVYFTTADRGPQQITLGQGKVIVGFEEGVIGMRVGERKTFSVPPEKAYGPVHPELIQTVGRDMMPAGFEPAVGKQLETTIQGVTLTVVIIAVTDTTVTVDANHPLAGKTLHFDVRLTEISGSPVPNAPLGQPVLVWLLAAALLVVLIAFAAYFAWSRPRLRMAAVLPSDTERRLVAEMAKLDDDFDAGQIDEEEYRATRAQVKARLARLVRQQPRGRA